MKLIVGLGNPDKEYLNTRHNIGFKCIDAFMNKNKIKLNIQKFNGLFYKNKDFILAKPLTYMNCSGIFVKQISEYYKIPKENILIIYDDIYTNIGKFKFKLKGSSGGQNGMKSIIQELKTNEINRFKIGIGQNSEIPLANYVLGSFTTKEIELLNNIKEKIIKIIEFWIQKDSKELIQKIKYL